MNPLNLCTLEILIYFTDLSLPQQIKKLILKIVYGLKLLRRKSKWSSQQTFLRWSDLNLVYINRINVSRPFTNSCKPFKNSVVQDESTPISILWIYKSKWTNLFHFGINPVKTNRNNTASQVIVTDRKCS